MAHRIRAFCNSSPRAASVAHAAPDHYFVADALCRRPLLALDRNGNGAIDNGAELFGDATPGSGNVNGYIALSQLDRNADGWVTREEAPWLLLWFDRNADGRSDDGELQSASDHLSAAGTDYREHRRVDQYGNRYAWNGWRRLADGKQAQTAQGNGVHLRGCAVRA